MDEQFVHEDQMRNARTQGVGSMVSEQNRQNALELMQKMHKIDTQNAAAKARIENNLDKALQCVDNVRDFVGSPEHILGNPKTKHGEIAENVDVWFHNADQIMRNRKADATFEGVGRTVATDYKVHGVDVQSKYINGANNSLSHVLKHMEDYIGNYEAFGKDGYYVIPKDQYELIQRVLKDDKEISSKTARAINEKLEKIKELSGNRELGDIIRPGEVDYAAVQQGKIHETLDKKTDQLNQTADSQKQRADERSDKKREQAQQEAAPSLQKAGKAAAEAAFISGGFQLAVGIYSKCKEGKKINEFTVDDWKDIGIDTAKAAAEGGISGFAIYSITNFTSISAGPAAAGVSLAFSVSELAYRKSTGAISDEEFKESCQMAALNAAVSAVGAAIGQELIPIPLLGAWIGSFIATQGLERLCDEGFHNALTMSAYEVRKMTQRLEYGTARMDSIVFLGGREASTLKDISENWLGKATISMQTEGRSRGQSESYSQNMQRLGRELMTTSEITTMPGDKCILQLRGLPPFLSPKYDLKKHPNYKYTAEFDKKKNAFRLESLFRHRPLRLKPEDEYTVYEVDGSDTDEEADLLNFDDLDSDEFV